MLRVENLIDAIQLAQAMGERPYGHFNHDDYCIIGPIDEVVSATAAQTNAPPGRYELFEDPDTDEVLARQITND